MLLLAVGCGEEKKMSQQDAGTVYGLTSAAVGQAYSAIGSGIAAAGTTAKLVAEGDVFEYDAETGNFSGSIQSAEGGMAEFQGTYTSAEDGSFTYTFDVTFIDWVSQGVTLNGIVTLEVTGSATAYTWTYSGEVEASGSVSGTASFEITVSSDGTIEGTVGGYEINQGA